MWFEDAYTASNGIKCYPTPTALNTCGNDGPIQNLEAKLQMLAVHIVMATYQLSLELSSSNCFVSELNIIVLWSI